MSDDLAERIVDAINRLAGTHPGHRAVHAKGVCCRGRFTASPEAATLSRAAHLQGDAIAATVRFSNGSGNPNAHDGERDGRGMATRFHLPDGSATDIVALTLPVFFVRTPEDFLAFTTARAPQPDTGQPDMEAVGAFLEAHPEAHQAVGLALGTPPPAGYAQCAFHGIHAFRLVDASGTGRYVRYHWQPDAGEATIDDDDAQGRAPGYLGAELAGRLAAGSVGFTLQAQLGEEGDPIDDPTVLWPAERRTVTLGHLELDEPAGDECAPMVFDPTRVTDGIECSPDPILAVRSAAYGVSYSRRTAKA